MMDDVLILRDKRARYVFLLVIFMMGSVFALGITPARTTIDFEAGMEKTVSFDIINSGSEDIKVVFSVQGGLAEYISLDVKEGEILASEGKKSFSYSLNFPEKLEPGLHTGEVYAIQPPSGEVSEGSQLLAMLAVVTQVYLYVPYPGKYASAKMYVYGANVEEDIKFVIPVVSAGEFDLSAVRANVDIYNKMGEKIDSFGTDSVSINSGMRKELVYNWKADVEIGEYIAKATVIYDDGTISLEESFSVGSKELELQEINVGGFSLGEIAKLEMLVENKWSEAIKDVLINTTIYNNRGGVVSAFKSSDYSVGAFAKEVFVSYWDTEGVVEGDYDVDVSIKYGEEESKNNLKFKVSENKLVVVGLGYVISAEGESDRDNTLVIIVILLVLMNVIWFLILRKKLKK